MHSSGSTRSALPRVLFLSAVGLALAVVASCSMNSMKGGSQAAEVATGSSVVAEVNGRQITLQELDERIGPQLYEARSEALDDWVQELVVETAAAEQGVDAKGFVDAEAAQLGEVTDADIQTFFDENKERMRPDETFENVKPQIKRYLEQKQRSEVLANLRDSANVVVSLEPPRVKVVATGPALGPADAAVTIVEFSDYQCPFCSRAEPVIMEVLEKYPNDVRLVFRHLPLDSIHPLARGAAVAAVCADEQGQFWAFHEMLFKHQRELEPEKLTEYASELGLDAKAFDACRKGPAAAKVVSDDLKAGRDAGVSGTPAFYVNGIKLSGARPLEDFVEVIDRELQRRGKNGA